MSQNLTLLAGKKALSLIQDEGLVPKKIKVIAGAAGGPKWLVLHSLDKAICSLFKNRKEPLFLIGSSIGAWRFAAYAQKKQAHALDTFLSVYLSQTYSSKPTVEEVGNETIRIMNAFLTDKGVKEILSHPYMRLNIMAVRCKNLVARSKKIPLMLGLGGAAFFNAINRKFLKLFFERSLFYDPRNNPPFFDMNTFPSQKIEITKNNLKPALTASGAIPMVMPGVENIPDALDGVYRDGGMIDYHLDIPFLNSSNELVLYPHYINRIIPGWFDKILPWRKADPLNIENVLLVSPSEIFIQDLPHKKIPDRNDFFNFSEKDRIIYWEKVIKACKRLGEEFLEAIESKKIKRLVKPL